MPVTETRLEPRLIRLALVLSIGSAATLLDTTIVSVAIDRLTREFGSPLATIQWVTTAYLLALTAMLPLTGWAVARFGTRWVWRFCLTGFLLGSVLCAVAWSAGALIVFRVIQGLGGGMLLPLLRIVLAEQAGQDKLGRVMSFVIVPTQLAPVVGPVLGGLIIGAFDWRWAFLVNVPVIVAALALSRGLVTGGPAETRQPLDLRGLALLSPGLAILVYGLTSYGEIGRLSTVATTGLIAGIVLLLGYGVHALRTVTPLLDLRLFRDRSFSACAALVFIFGGSLFGAMFLLPLYYQQIRAATPLEAGLLLAPQGIGAMIGTVFVGRILDRTGATRTIMLAGLALAVAGTVPFAIAGSGTPVAVLAVALVVRGAGLTASLLPSITATYATLPKSQYAAATTGTRILQQIGGSLGTAVLAVILQRGSFPAAFWTAVAITAAAALAALALPNRSTV
ncbi:DHA2 family efflux MFS transporter permease subunit [Kribbella speibonae]|uniref:DHA2 family efflux MFS transporter permease subunit n=1 Tax=Kribbella speibonae TaxID=1572660 RepID=A0A4R0JAI7_9ACTN|nr:DHA2 family efflux MFS transporter permease subunit [Kribbella speibonae]TCC42374.1 DHA2 family efflux MFS transporter permease subunit [Kribbella speibonae]